MNLRRENVKMVGKLAVVVAGMFGFGYALVPMYKAICEFTGINVLAVGERNTASFGDEHSGQHAGGHQPYHHGGVRRQFAGPVELPSGEELAAGASG